MLCEWLPLIVPHAAVGDAGMYQQQRVARAGDLVVDVSAIDVGETCGRYLFSHRKCSFRFRRDERADRLDDKIAKLPARSAEIRMLTNGMVIGIGSHAGAGGAQ